MNVQFALHEGEIFVLEANPRASRTVPFVEKAVGIDLVGLACRVALGERLAEIGARVPETIGGRGQGGGAAVRAVPRRRPGARARDALDRRGHGARAGLPDGLREGLARGRLAAAVARRTAPRAWRSSRSATATSRPVTLLAQRLSDLGFALCATPGTARAIGQLGIPVTRVAKIGDADRRGDGRRPDPRRPRRPDRQHPRRPRRAPRRLRDPARRDLRAHPVHHDDRGRVGRGAGDRPRRRGRAEGAAGPARGADRRMTA